MTVWKTTYTIYSPYDPAHTELVDHAQDATDGLSICVTDDTVIADPTTDPDFPHEFFADPDDYLDRFLDDK